MRWRVAAAAVVVAAVAVVAVVGRSGEGTDPVPVAVIGATLAARLVAVDDVEQAVAVVERWGSAQYRAALVPVLRSAFGRLRAEAGAAQVAVEVTGTEVLERSAGVVTVRVSSVVTVSDAGRSVRRAAVADVVVVDEAGWRVQQVVSR